MADDKAPKMGAYEVPVRGHKTTVQMTADEAKEMYGSDAKRVGSVETTDPEPVSQPPWATPVPPAGESEVPDEDVEPRPKARGAANKARGTDKS